MDFLEAIDARIRERSILKHPFYQAWKMGGLSRAGLLEYAKQYYKHVAAFPAYLSAVHSQMESGGDRRAVLQNLVDEEHGERNHLELWLQFAQALGVSRQEVYDAKATDSTKNFVDAFKQLAQSSPAEGIAALYAYESQIPAVSEEKMRGLKQFYGVSDEKGLEYFTVHAAADVEHAAAERKLLKRLAVNEETKQKMLAAVDKALDAYWQMLSGVQEQCGLTAC